jgi:GNAT superfamily N-acetyltransferase
MPTIRPADLIADAPGIAQLLNLTLSDPATPEQVCAWWQPREGETRYTAVATDQEGRVVGMADVQHEAWMLAGRFRIHIAVEPDRRKQGIGARLHAEVVRFAGGAGATRLEGQARDDLAESLAFAQRRGYLIERHAFTSTLDLVRFDERPFVAALDRAQAAGICFFSLADLDPATEEHRRKLYALNRKTALDNPGNGGVFADYEAFSRNVFQACWFRADGQILAADGDEWVGLAAVGLLQGGEAAYNAFTGVRRAYRGRGLATALKLLAIRRAREYGAQAISTNNDSQNAPMLAINRMLGYQPEPGYYDLVREWAAG